MLRFLFPRQYARHARIRTVRRLIDATNERRFDVIESLLTPDVVMTDVGGSKITGRDRFIAVQRDYIERSGGYRIVLDTVDGNRGEVLATGHLESATEELSGRSMWRLIFEGDLISHIQVTRERGRMTMPKYARATERAEKRAAAD